MQGTNRIYEEPSRLSQALVVGLSVAVVLMGGWLAVTIAASRSATGTADGEADPGMGGAPAIAPAEGAAVSSSPDAPRQTARSNSVHFDWPEEFTSSAAPPPPRAALPLAPELPATRDLGRSPWPAAATDAVDRGLQARQPASAPSEATDAILDILAPAPRTTAAAPAPASHPPQRRQKARIESDAGQ